MGRRWHRTLTHGTRRVGQLLGRIDVLALFPILTLTAVWLELGDVVLVSALLLPMLLAVHALAAPLAESRPAVAEGRIGQSALLAKLDQAAAKPSHSSACLYLQIDNWPDLVDRFGGDAVEGIAARCAERIETTLRADDLVVRIGDGRFAVALHPIRAARLGMRETLADRLRGTLSESFFVDGVRVKLMVCIGHTDLVRDATDCAAATLVAAEAALAEAHRAGPNATKAYAPRHLQKRITRNRLAEEVDAALEAGDIRPWFQPQVCARTGVLSGVEALARWHHPRRGTLEPGDFLQAVEDAGCMDKLGHAILCNALAALRGWDDDGLCVPAVSVNVSAGELRKPDLVDRVIWELDRFDLAPDRLTVEILETVAADGPEDTINRTLQGLRAQGIQLDLDDFGIGQASLSAIRRFGVSRIKIDRSFIIGLDTDDSRLPMTRAIFAMADHLGIDTLAEGVETEAVQALLCDMGCKDVQGFFIARPMPLTEMTDWIVARAAHDAPQDVVQA